MKLKAPFLIGGAIAACGGLSLAGVPSPAAAPESGTPQVAVVEPAPTVVSVREQRDRFNGRVQDMLASGKGARLTDAPPSRRTAVPQAALRPAVSRAVPPAAPMAQAPGSGQKSPASGLQTITLSGAPSGSIAAALGRPTNAVDCLAQAIYYEARSESEEGQAAVAEVILNRARSGRYPREVCDVVYQRNSRTCQFSYTCDGSIGRTRVNAQSWGRAERIARAVYAGQAQSMLPAHSVNYHANYVAPSWGRRLERVRQIGAHIFYGSALGGRTPGSLDRTPAAGTPSGQLTFVRLDALDRAYDMFRGAEQAGVQAAPTGQGETD